MAQAYLEYRFTLKPKTPWEDILLAQLQELPFESFFKHRSRFKCLCAQG